MSSFDDWYHTVEKPVCAYDVWLAARKFQREKDALISSEYNPNGSWGKIIAKAIREQEVDG